MIIVIPRCGLLLLVMHLMLLVLVRRNLLLLSRLRVLLHVPEAFVTTHHVLLAVLFAQFLVHLSVDLLKVGKNGLIRCKDSNQMIDSRSTLL